MGTFVNIQYSWLNVLGSQLLPSTVTLQKTEVCLWGFLPVNASVVVVAIEELDLLKGLLAGVVTGQIRVHAKKQVERCRPWEGNERTRQDGEKGGMKTGRGLRECVSHNKCS